MKRAVIDTGVNIKPQSVMYDFSAISAWIFMQENEQKNCKMTFLMIYICRLYSFQDINEKLALFDTNYPW